MSYNIEPDWSPSHPIGNTRHVGYAPTVDLGEKGALFLTFAHATRTPDQWRERNNQVSCSFDDVGCLPFAAYHKPGVLTGSSQEKAALDELLHQSGPREVPFAALPGLVRFVDINEPNTLVPVSPDDLAASLDRVSNSSASSFN